MAINKIKINNNGRGEQMYGGATIKDSLWSVSSNVEGSGLYELAEL